MNQTDAARLVAHLCDRTRPKQVCTFCVTLAGQLTKTFRFKFGGLASLILTEEKAVNDYSLVTIAQAIPHAARNGELFSVALTDGLDRLTSYTSDGK